MPKLSQYVGQQKRRNGEERHPNIAHQPAAAGSGWGSQPSHSSSGHLVAAQAPLPPPTDAQGATAAAPTAAHRNFRETHAKRIKEHGPRRFRWPDGSLKYEKPPKNPYTAANRDKYAPLVTHCRTHGGDRAYETTGQSLRYGLGVSHQEHVEYLKVAELEPGIDAEGRILGFHPQEGRKIPLADPAHALNSYYKQGAEEVFKDARGRLL